MSAIMEQNEIADNAGKASRSAIRAYRESVARGECDETILFNGRKLKIEWDKDRSVYLSRVQAAESLNVEIPRLQAIAAETAQPLAEAEAFVRSTVPDTMSVGDLRQRIHAANDKLPVATPSRDCERTGVLVQHIPGRLSWPPEIVGHPQPRCHCRLPFPCRANPFPTAADAGPDSTSQALQRQIEASAAPHCGPSPMLDGRAYQGAKGDL